MFNYVKNEHFFVLFFVTNNIKKAVVIDCNLLTLFKVHRLL